MAMTITHGFPEHIRLDIVYHSKKGIRVSSSSTWKNLEEAMNYVKNFIRESNEDYEPSSITIVIGYDHKSEEEWNA